ncbi:MAG: hypothetical protein K2G29_08825 [Muribaculaceae bacterium]|nr:hypothetical protein [Muribaculaceae bacterium]
MTEQEFLKISREMLDIFKRSTVLFQEVQSDLNDRYRKGEISYEEWVMGKKENERKEAFFREQFKSFLEKVDGMKKV